MDKQDLIKTLEELGFPPAEIAVYISMLDGANSTKDIMKVTGEKRPTVYYSLNSLESKGLVSKTGKDYGNKYQLESVEKLSELVKTNIRKQERLLDKVDTFGDFYKKNIKNEKVLVSHFDTFESIKAAIFYTLYGKEKTIRSIVPGDNFFNDIGIDFIREYTGEKVKRGIKTKALWEDIPNKKVLDEYYATSQIRQLPLDMHNTFKTTIFIYDDKTFYIGPKKENYAVLIQSKEHAKMMISIFENIWKNSEVVKN